MMIVQTITFVLFAHGMPLAGKFAPVFFASLTGNHSLQHNNVYEMTNHGTDIKYSPMRG